MELDDENDNFEEGGGFNRERDYYAYFYEGEILQDELGIIYKEQYDA